MKRTRIVSVSATGADSVALPASQSRLGLIISVPSGGNVSFAFGQTAVLNAGVNQTSTGSYVYLTKDMIGEDITAEVHCIADAARTVGILEIYGD